MMLKYKQEKRTSLPLIILPLITAISLLTNTPIVRATEAETIPNQFGSDYFLLLENQSVSSSAEQTSSSGTHTVRILSIGNNRLSARFSIFVPPTEAGTDATGNWWLLILGTGGKFWFDFKLGVVPVTGPIATIDIGSVVSFGIVIGGVTLTSPVSPENPVTYTISVTGDFFGG
jgi:hypothetical protein